MTTDSVPKDIWQATFKELLEKFNERFVVPAHTEQPQGVYQWPLGSHTLEVVFHDNQQPYVVPFTIFKSKTEVLGQGCFDTQLKVVCSIVYPDVKYLTELCTSLGMMVQQTSDDRTHGFELYPPLIAKDDINDSWVEKYRQDHPGTSYASAVSAAVKEIKQTATVLQRILDKHVY
jgi:hypothetical protein